MKRKIEEVQGGDINCGTTPDYAKIIVNMVKKGHSIFFTGDAGTGKSTIISKIVEEVKGKIIAVTSTTALSAIQIEGITIHRWSGVGTERRNKKLMVSSALSKRARSWRNADILIIDELSMIEALFLDNLSYVGMKVRGNVNQQFGGLQLVFSADYFQLPFVVGNGIVSSSCYHSFLSEVFKKGIEYFVNLTEVHRQSDAVFIDLLKRIRRGEKKYEDIILLQSRMQSKLDSTELERIRQLKPTIVYCENKGVDQYNSNMLRNLRGKAYNFRSLDLWDGVVDADEVRKVFQESRVPQSQIFKTGAKVMSSYNYGDNICNGSQGEIVAMKKVPTRSIDTFVKESSAYNPIDPKVVHNYLQKQSDWVLPIVKFCDGTERVIFPRSFSVNLDGRKISRMCIPLKLAWSLTVHKTQGLSMDGIELKSKKMYFPGQFYVFISRVRNMNGLILDHFSPDMIVCDVTVRCWMEKIFGDFSRPSVKKNLEIEGNFLKKRKL